MIEFRSLRLEEIEAWFDHCMYVFNGGDYSEDYRKYFMNHWYNDPWRDIESILVAVENEKILSTVRIFNRKIYFNGHIISMGGIGEVSTKPESQGMGLSTKLLRLAIKRMEELGVKVSLLGTSEDKFGYYGKLGWQNLVRTYKQIKAAPLINNPVKVRHFNQATDILEIMEIYKENSIKISGSILRDDKYYWENWVKSEFKNCFVAEINGKVAAYMDIQIEATNIRVREFGALAGYRGLLEAIIGTALANTTVDLSSARIICPVIVETDVQIDGYLEDKGKMIRLINAFSIGDKRIETTGELIDALSTDSYGAVTLWDTDGF